MSASKRKALSCYLGCPSLSRSWGVMPGPVRGRGVSALKQLLWSSGEDDGQSQIAFTNLSSASSIQQLPVSELWGLRTRLFVTSGIALRGKLLKARQVKLGQVAAVLTEWKDNIEPEHHLRRWGNRVVLLGHSQSSVTLRHTVINVVTMTMDQNRVNIKSSRFS